VDRQTEQTNLAQKRFSVNKKSAMTLAEVLLTLGIIGVVAAMTIPTLIENNQKTQYVTALKKVYSNFNQVLVQYSANNGCVGDLKCTGLFNGDGNAVVAALAPYFKIAKQCGSGVSGCFPGQVSSSFDGSTNRSSFLNGLGNSFITQDGMAFYIESWNDNCASNVSTGATGDMEQGCGNIIVDVNGYKGPNNFGRDIFYFWITNGRGPNLYPVGGQDDADMSPWNSDPAYLKCDSSFVSGVYCTGRVMDEGWQMNY